MDELFLIPSSPLAMPRAYWLDQPFSSSQLVLLQPSQFEWHRIQEFMIRDDPGFDMDILNSLYKHSAMVLPHRRYNMLTAEFRAEEHSKYLGSPEQWNGTSMLEKAKYIHFSDWPVPKPWIKAEDGEIEKAQPKLDVLMKRRREEGMIVLIAIFG
jgi:alpha-N-acetylglucosamine transferase